MPNYDYDSDYNYANVFSIIIPSPEKKALASVAACLAINYLMDSPNLATAGFILIAIKYALDKHDEDNSLNSFYGSNRKNRLDTLFFNSSYIPRAEKKALLALAACMAVSHLTDSKALLTMGLGLTFLTYFTNKFNQDQAVARYYDEIQNSYDIQSIYNHSNNVKEMGGIDAIHNACALRVFPRLK